jgi:hypothetical protein
MNDDDLSQATKAVTRRHLCFGWWALLCFLVLGIVLEGFHGFKVGWYLNVENDTRRLMWTLAHAHGTLLAVVNLVFGLSLVALPLGSHRSLIAASRCLLAANVLLPAGFFVGGIFSIAGDPGLGILLVPVGALLLLVGVLLTARASLAAASTIGLQAPAKGKQNEKQRRKRHGGL